MLRVTFLGTGGALPTKTRNPSSIMLNRDGELLLFDCGEGAQQQMMRAKTGMMAISSIFITHFHADHVLGIPGLLQTLSFHGREEPLDIYGPMWVEDFTRLVMALGYCKLKFEVRAHTLIPGEAIEKDDYFIVTAKGMHSVPSLAYAFVEKPRPGRFDRDRAIELGVPEGPLFSKLHNGESVEVGGRVILPEDVVGEPRAGRKIVYSGDTRPCDEVIELSRGADLLIHDGTLAEEKLDWAKESLHSTAREAAEVALEANVSRLILTHISSRYSDDTSVLLEEAKAVFENVEIASDLFELEIPFVDKN